MQHRFLKLETVQLIGSGHTRTFSAGVTKIVTVPTPVLKFKTPSILKKKNWKGDMMVAALEHVNIQNPEDWSGFLLQCRDCRSGNVSRRCRVV